MRFTKIKRSTSIATSNRDDNIKVIKADTGFKVLTAVAMIEWRLVRRKSADVSEKPIASIFRLEYAKQDTSSKACCFRTAKEAAAMGNDLWQK
jgi:hypothetical protein